MTVIAAGRIILLGWLGLRLAASPAGAALREPVYPRRNVDEFQPVLARFIRFSIRATNIGEPGIDELEVYGPEDSMRNLALAANGARATASGSLAGYQIHALTGVNDGRYGNGHCWIADRREGAWVQIELPRPALIQRVVWSRDREGKFTDRLATRYLIEAALEPEAWRAVASSEDRQPLTASELDYGLSPVTRQFVNRFAPMDTALSSEAEHGSAEYTIDSWQTPDGLPANTITAIAQSGDGYLWLGTLNGLARFDGLRFKVFGKAEGLPSDRVLCLLFDDSGTLWIGTDGGGLARWRQDGCTILTTKDGLAHDVVLALAQDAEHRLWIATADGLSCWQDGRFVRDGRLVPTTRVPISRLAVHAGRIWAAENGGVFWLREGALDRPDIAGEPSWFSSMFAIHNGASGKLWFGGANNYVSCLSNEVVTVYPEQAGQLLGSIWELLETRSGDLWVGTASGGLRRLRQGRFTSLTTQEGLSDNSVRCLFEDREENLWVGTVGGGLNRVKPRRLRTFTTHDGLSHNVVMSLAETEDGSIWIGSNCGGLNVRQNGQVAPYQPNYLLDNECIWSLAAARDGNLWIGTWGAGLFRKEGERITPFANAHPSKNEPILALCEAADGALWLGTYSAGLELFRQGSLTRFTTSNGLSANFVTAIVQDRDPWVWVGTGGAGLNKLESRGTNSEPPATLVKVFNRQQGLPNDFVRTLYLDGSGVLWIGTDGGLARLANGRLSAFTHAQGLPDEVISQILEDGAGSLWLGSNRGIFRIGKSELAAVAEGRVSNLNWIAYGRADGMESAQCTGGFCPAGLRSHDGKLWFSTVKGLVMVDPTRLPRNQRAPKVLIEESRVDGAAVADRAQLLRLSHRTGRIEFQFTATSLVAPERNRFRHRLEGVDNDWVEDGSQRTAAYHRLPPGGYRFRVIACNADSVWNETGATVEFRLLPPFWRTWWFGAAAGAFVLGGGSWTVRFWSVRRLQQKLRLLQEQHLLEQERTRIAQDIHDELGASLTRITLLTDLGQKHRERPEEISADLGKIAGTAREAVRAMDAIVWAVNPQNDSLDHFANYISQYAEELFRLTPIRCRLDVPAELPERPLSAEARHQLFLAAKEGLTNVVRHSGASEVWLRLASDGKELSVSIEDNGRGLPGDPARDGQDGLNNIRNRLESLGGCLLLKSAPGQGTQIRMNLPLQSKSQL